jgi:hypothetical protein
MSVLDTNGQNEAYRVGAALKVAQAAGLITDTDIVNAAVRQILRLTVGGAVGATGGGNILVKISANLPNLTAKAITVAVANSDATASIAAKIKQALSADADVHAAFGSISNSAAVVDLQRTSAADQDATMNIGYDVSVSAPASGPGSATGSTLLAGQGKNNFLSILSAKTLPAGCPEVVRQRTMKAWRTGYDLSILTDNLLDTMSTISDVISATGVPTTYKSRSFYD